jgi:hypothetical protein
MGPCSRCGNWNDLNTAALCPDCASGCIKYTGGPCVVNDDPALIILALRVLGAVRDEEIASAIDDYRRDILRRAKEEKP